MSFDWLDVVSIFLIVCGCFFALTGALGMLRFPDFYTRLHAAGKSDTLAQFLIMVGCALQVQGNTSDPVLAIWRLALIALILFITAPTATHAITKAAHLAGLKPYGCRQEEIADTKDDTREPDHE